MAITSHDVARLAGVSQPTVSRALRNDRRVSAATREKVLKAAAALNYIPSEAGRTLSTRATQRVGVIVTDLANPFYPHLVAPLHDELHLLGYRMMLITERSDDAVSSEQLLDQSLDGVVLTTATTESRLPDELDRRRLPYVFLNRDSGRQGDYASVVDNKGGGRQVAEFLLGLGHRRIAGIFGAENTTTGREREMGFRLALAEGGVGLPDEFVRHGPFAYETGYLSLPELLAADPAPTAVFCGNDVVAMGVLNAALAAGVRIPDELTVVGFDDIPMAGWEMFRLTTVRHDLGELSRQAARLLARRIIGEADPAGERLILPTELLARNTHAAVAA
ncbi:HTH-type transcriptional regulator DegA [Streptomyces sp. YIM 130001]|uniref:LacI family DNA-binding transcriptional regulator n=1 Tax=Streptomyces sp. YIM 130001 TaxID=2259644 RepID=UPI000E647198|nr:LacI family DNA-binding transcriptional regulator [Streptomyces sp. YIM 130001]RII16089.1 HTH-type transcriptional regulator DegA [Streptomyces sp. YIM 130001]